MSDGDERADLERQTEALAIARSFNFLGFRTDVADLLATSDLFVVPSLSEGMPLSILEAMSLSLPTVASGVGDISELAEEGEQGLLTPPGDAGALASAPLALTVDPERAWRFGIAGQSRTLVLFSFAAMAAKYEETDNSRTPARRRLRHRPATAPPFVSLSPHTTTAYRVPDPPG